MKLCESVCVLFPIPSPPLLFGDFSLSLPSAFGRVCVSSKPAGCLVAQVPCRDCPATELICLAVLGRVVGGQLLVALKVGGTCFD